MLIVFSGHIGQCGTGGQAWANMQYLLGFQRLGHEVYYLEDVGDSPGVWDWQRGEWTAHPAGPTEYIQACLEPVGLAERWMYRAGNESHGPLTPQFHEICAAADLFIMRGVPIGTWRTEYDRPKRRVFIDVDPGFTQLRLVKGDSNFRTVLSRCEHLFTIAQRIGMPDCTIPNAGFHWKATLPPVSLEHWPWGQSSSPTYFSAIMRWRGLHDIDHGGISYGQKDKEFPQFLNLPQRTPQRFRLALMGAAPEKLVKAGWDVVAGHAATATPRSYSAFIQCSRAEFSVAKQGYLVTKGGWFRDRSVCYLASGRPILVQDTCLADWLPIGAGVVVVQ